MGQKLQGLLIRKRRQEREWSQAALCNGICAVSYLSKIEQGKVESSPEVLDLLFRRLDIQWQDDPAFCREAAAWFEEYYDRLFSGEDLQDMTQELLLRETVYRNSPFFLDWLLLSWAATGQVQEEVEEFVSAMDARQQNLHLCLKGQFQDLLRIAERSYFFLQAGKHAYWRGDYSYAVACFFQGAERADIALSTFHAIAKQTIGGLSQGLELTAPIIFEGGPLTFNPTLVRVFAERLNLEERDIVRPDHPETIVARGTAIAVDELFPGQQDAGRSLRRWSGWTMRRPSRRMPQGRESPTLPMIRSGTPFSAAIRRN